MNNQPIRVNLFKHGSDAFVELLDDSGISHQKLHLFPPGTIVAAPGMIEIIGATAGLGIPAALSAVAIQWLKNKASRKIIVTTAAGDTVHAEGLSFQELQEVIEQAKTIDVIQTERDHGI